jgi:hypothetical protein
MKTALVIPLVFVGLFASAQTEPVATLQALSEIIPTQQSLLVLKGETQESTPRSCSLSILRRDYLMNISKTDSTIDLVVSIGEKNKLGLHLNSTLSKQSLDDDTEFDFVIRSKKEIELFYSEGRWTDQYHGYNGYALKLARLNPSHLEIQLDHSWADDDGGQGLSSTKCLLKL